MKIINSVIGSIVKRIKLNRCEKIRYPQSLQWKRTAKSFVYRSFIVCKHSEATTPINWTDFMDCIQIFLCPMAVSFNFSLHACLLIGLWTYVKYVHM